MRMIVALRPAGWQAPALRTTARWLLLPGPPERYIRRMPEQAGASSDALLFEAVIVPHRSLSPRGLVLLVGFIATLCGLTALRFWLIGAWPVIGFSVLEVGLALWLLQLNARGARASELLMLSENALHIVRIDASGRRQERSISPGWLNVVLEEAPGRVPRLVLAARNVREEVGAVLGEAEKRDLATALGAALHRLRNPVFENSQLREPDG